MRDANEIRRARAERINAYVDQKVFETMAEVSWPLSAADLDTLLPFSIHAIIRSLKRMGDRGITQVAIRDKFPSIARWKITPLLRRQLAQQIPLESTPPPASPSAPDSSSARID